MNTSEITNSCHYIDNSNNYWLNYLSLEKALIEISDYVAINKENRNVHSLKIMQLYLTVCSEIDSLYKNIRKNIPAYEKQDKKEKYLTMKHHKRMIKDHLYPLTNTKLSLNISGENLQFQPFKYLNKGYTRDINIQTTEYSQSGIDWWDNYNAVKHNRDKHFNMANLANLLEALSALHILNLVYGLNFEDDKLSSFETLTIVAPATPHIPILQLKNSCITTHVGGGGFYYFSRLDNFNPKGCE